MFVTEEKIKESKEKYLESISILKHALYDEKGVLRDSSLFGGGDEDRQNKIKLLEYYEEQLKSLDDPIQYEPVVQMGKCLIRKKVSPEIQEEVNKNQGQIYSMTIGDLNLPAIPNFMQYPDGKYHKTFVLYKGYSEEYSTEFLVYVENNQVMLTPVIEKDGKLMKHPIHTKEMISSFEKQMLSKMEYLTTLWHNEEKLIEFSKGIPNLMHCSTVDQYEEVEVPIVVGRNMQPKTQTKSLPPEPPKTSTNKKTQNNVVYRYLFSESDFKKYFFPNFKHQFSNYKKFYDFKSKNSIYIVSTSGHPLDMDDKIGKSISEEEYRYYEELYSCSGKRFMSDLNEITNYVEILRTSYPDAEIILSKETDGIYIIDSSIPVESFVLEGLNNFGIDLDGYIIEKDLAIETYYYETMNSLKQVCCPFMNKRVGKIIKADEQMKETKQYNDNYQSPEIQELKKMIQQQQQQMLQMNQMILQQQQEILNLKQLIQDQKLISTEHQKQPKF